MFNSRVCISPLLWVLFISARKWWFPGFEDHLFPIILWPGYASVWLMRGGHFWGWWRAGIWGYFFSWTTHQVSFQSSSYFIAFFHLSKGAHILIFDSIFLSFIFLFLAWCFLLFSQIATFPGFSPLFPKFENPSVLRYQFRLFNWHLSRLF